MKKILKVFFWLIGVLIAIPLVLAVYNFVVLGQMDAGLAKVYHYCENGIYTTYPFMVFDGSSTYYDKEGNMIGQCHSWNPGDTCESAKTRAGQCVKKGVHPVLFFSPILAIVDEIGDRFW